MRPAFFLDRDGTINIDTGYIDSPEKISLIPQAAEAIALLNQAEIPVVVVTNQSGIARGYYSEADLIEIHQALDQLLANQGAKIDAYYYCPHHVAGNQKTYSIQCSCRKPEPGLLKTAVEDLEIKLSKSVMIGDKPSDVQAGIACNCQSILVRTGNGKKSEEEMTPELLSQITVEDNLYSAVTNWLALNKN